MCHKFSPFLLNFYHLSQVFTMCLKFLQFLLKCLSGGGNSKEQPASPGFHNLSFLCHDIGLHQPRAVSVLILMQMVAMMMVMAVVMMVVVMMVMVVVAMMVMVVIMVMMVMVHIDDADGSFW